MTLAARIEQRCRLFYTRDKNTGYLFLVDTGTQISVSPPEPKQKHTLSTYTLQVANGSNIETYGERSLRPHCPWFFRRAQMKTPKLGADFLSHFHLSVNMVTHPLIDSDT